MPKNLGGRPLETGVSDTPVSTDTRPTLASAGIDKNLAKAFFRKLQGVSLRALNVERPQNNRGRTGTKLTQKAR